MAIVVILVHVIMQHGSNHGLHSRSASNYIATESKVQHRHNKNSNISIDQETKLPYNILASCNIYMQLYYLLYICNYMYTTWYIAILICIWMQWGSISHHVWVTGLFGSINVTWLQYWHDSVKYGRVDMSESSVKLQNISE